jgi:aryl-alcohol dehydrogenase-like predicted oxidoreductase
MKYKNLGNTGINISEIGFGTWGLGGNSYGSVDKDISMKTLEFAYEQGINFFDTADSYGDGQSERIIGDALKHVREKVVYATKVGALPHTGRVIPHDFSLTRVNQCLEDSLKRLQSDYIDLYQLHSPPIEVFQNEELLETFTKFKREGKIRAIGISARSPTEALMAITDFGFDCVQVNFNLIDQRAIDCGLLSECLEKGVSIIARTPLCFGLLSGKYGEHLTFASNDHRSNWPKEQLAIWAKAIKLFNTLLLEQNLSPVQFALKFCLAQEGVSTTIPGMKTCEQVRENLSAINEPELDPKCMQQVRKIYDDNIFFLK